MEIDIVKSDLVEITNCLFCTTPDFVKVYSVGNWNIVKCKKCQFHFTNPRPTNEGLPQYYTEEYFKDERHKDQFYNKDGTIKIDKTDFTNRIKKIENYFDKRGKILEIGAARGNFLNIMKNRGWEVHGVEISKGAVIMAMEMYNVELFCGTFEEFYGDEKFDVICMFQTLEHLPDPVFVIQKAYDLLNRNGLLIIEVPNFRGFDMKFSRENKRLIYDLPRHLNHFHPIILSKHLKLLGLKILEVDRYYPNFVLNIFRLRNKLRVFEPSSELREAISSENNLVVPMEKQRDSFFGKILKKVSLVFPGWRFTIVAQKS